MSEELFTYSEVQNLGFFTNPNLQDSKLKAMNRREQLMQGAYYYANSDRDDECRNKSAEVFGRGTIPLSDKENSAYFLGHAVLLESGYTGSPFEYFLQQDMDLPPEVTDEDTARIYIGNKVLNDMRAIYDKEAEYKKKVATVQNELPKHLAHLVATGSFENTAEAKKSMDVLNEIGMWDKLEPSINRARAAWASISHDARTVNGLQDIAKRESLAFIADLLSDENGKLDEAALMAFSSTVMSAAEKLQSKGTSFASSTGAAIQTTVESVENFVDNALDEDAKERAAQIAGGEAYAKAIEEGKSEEEAMIAAEKAAKATGFNDERVELLRGYMQSAINTALEPSEQAGTYAKIASEVGKLLGDSVIPMAGAIAATALTRGRGVGLIGQAAAGWAGGVAASKDAIINQAVAQAYVEGKLNPEEYGYYAGLGQAAAENIAGVGTSGFMMFKGINRFMTKAAAKATTSKVLSNAYARATLAWAATAGIEGTTELAEEEIGEALGSMLNAMARAAGSNVSEQQYVPLKTIKQMKPHQIASMYVFAGALGLGGAAANFAAAQKMSIDIGTLKAIGYSDKKAREVQAHGIETARKIEEVSNSNISEEAKESQINALKEERLEFLGKSFREDIGNASNEDIKKRSDAENEEFTYRAILASAIQNGLLEQALVDAGYIDGSKQADNNKYLVSYNEEDENGNVKLVQKEWNADQLIGFMTFQRGTKAHYHLREIMGKFAASQFAEKVASAEDLLVQLANLRDIPISELATIMQHKHITIDLFREFAEREAANIAADVERGIPLETAQRTSSNILSGVARQDVIDIADKATERYQHALDTDELKPDDIPVYPGINVSSMDGKHIVAFMNGEITLAKMLEEMMEIRVKQLTKGKPETLNEIGKTLHQIQSKLKGVKLFPEGKSSFTTDEIIEAFSHLAVAEVIANPEYVNHLNANERAVINEVLRNVHHAQHYNAIAGAWMNFKESEEGKAYLANGGKNLTAILGDAGFTFGKHFTSAEASAEQRVKFLKDYNFQPSFDEAVDQLSEQETAETELQEINAEQAKEPTVIPANESVTGETLVIEPQEEAKKEEVTYDNPLDKDASELRDKIANNKADTKDFANFFRKHNLSAAQATELGIRPLNQDGSPSAMYTKGKLIAKSFSKAKFNSYMNGKLSNKKLKKLLRDAAIDEAHFSIASMKEYKMAEEFRKVESIVELNAATFNDKGSRGYMLYKYRSTLERELQVSDTFTEEDKKKTIDSMVKDFEDVLVDIVNTALGKEVGGKKTHFIDWNKIEPQLFEGMPRRSVYKPNGDYKLNIDMGTLCTKREALDCVMDYLFEKGGIANIGPTALERIKDLLKENNFAIACAICFVEAKRARMRQDSIKTAFYWKATLRAAGINDGLLIDERTKPLTAEQTKRLEEMAGEDFKEAFEKYMPLEDRRSDIKDYDYGITANIMQKIAKLFLEDHGLAGILNASMLMRTSGVDYLLNKYGYTTSLLPTLAGMYGAATAKPLEGFYPYHGYSWIPAFDGSTMDKNREALYAIGGIRAQSFTDFNPLLFIDYVQMFADLEARRCPLHLYTKVPPLVKLFGKTGAMINMSLVPDVVDGVDKNHAGLKKNEKGEWVYAWVDESFPVKEAFELRKRKEFGGRVGIIAVGISYHHIIKMLRDPEIDMVIPYHKSGLPVAVQIKTGLDRATDYTDVQNTNHRSEEKRKDKVKVETFLFNEVHRQLLDDSLLKKNPNSIAAKYLPWLEANGYKRDARGAAAIYLQWCKDNDYVPKFEEFAGEENYYKLLIDFRAYDESGAPVQQGPVRLTDKNGTNLLGENWKEELKSNLEYREHLGDRYKAFSDADEFRKNNPEFVKQLEKIANKAPADGEVREIIVQRLRDAVGKNNLKVLPKSKFLDTLEESLAKTKGAEAAKAQVTEWKNNKGEVYGFVYKGVIHLNEVNFNANTPAHEYTHLWVDVLRKSGTNGETLWKKGVELLRKAPEWQSVLEDEGYTDIAGNEDAIASETLARIVGKLNEEFLYNDIMNPDKKPLRKKGVLDKIIEWIKEAWVAIRDTFSPIEDGKPLTLEEFRQMPLRDLWDKSRHKKFKDYARKVYKKTPAQRRKEMQQAQKAYAEEATVNIELDADFGITASKDVSIQELEAQGAFKDGAFQASNAIVTKPDANFAIQAMHVSPHEFYKFSTDFMGRGEGAQAFGWGLYFSGDKETNREYYRYFANEDYQMRLFRGGNELGEKELQKLVREVFMRHGGQELVDEMEEAIVYSVLREGAQKQLDDYETYLKEGGEDIFGLTGALQELAGMEIERKSVNLPAINYRVELNADDSHLLMWDEKVSAELHDAVRELKSGQPARGLVIQMPEASKECWEGYRIYSELTSVLGTPKAASEWLAERGYKGIKYLDGYSRNKGKGTYNYVIFSGDDIKITAINKSGKWSMTEGWEEYNDPTANFSIQALDPSEHFSGSPLAENMSNFIRRESTRLVRVLGGKAQYEDKVKAIADARAIIHAVDKYVDNGQFKLPRYSMARLKHLRRLIDKYYPIMANGKTRSFTKLDISEEAALQDELKKAKELIDSEVVVDTSSEEMAALREEVEAEKMPEIYREQARKLIDELSESRYTTPADIAKRMKGLERAAENGSANNDLLEEDIIESGYKSQPKIENKRTVLKKYAKAKLAELRASEEAKRKEFEDNKSETINALLRVDKEGKIPHNSKLGEAERRQLEDMVQKVAPEIIGEEVSNRYYKQLPDNQKKADKERSERIVRMAASGRVGELLSEMLDETANIIDAYLKEELRQKLLRITKAVKIKRTPSKRLKGKMNAASYRRLEEITKLMEMSTRAKNTVLGDIEVARKMMEGGSIPPKEINDTFEQIIEELERNKQTIDIASVHMALNAKEVDVMTFGDFDSMTYRQAKAAANAVATLLAYGRTVWEAKTSQETAAVKAYLEYFLDNTTEEMGKDSFMQEAARKLESWITFLPNSAMNTAQLFLALSSYEPLKPILDDMRYKLAAAVVARDMHIQNIRKNELAEFGRIIGMEPETKAGYSNKQLKKLRNKFDDFFIKNNEVHDTGIIPEGRETQLRYTNWELLSLILTYRQPHYQVNAEEHGFTPEVLDKMREHIGEDMMTFGNFIQQAIVNDGTIAVYEEREGIPMPDNPLYYPGNININTLNTTREEPLTNPYKPAAMHDFLHVRVKHKEEVKAHNAYLVYRHAIDDRANYVYLDPVTTPMNRLLAHNEFSNRLLSLIGPSLVSQLKTTLREIQGASRQESAIYDLAGKGLAGMLGTHALMVLPFNPGTYFRQTSAVANAGLMPDISPAAYAKYAVITEAGLGAVKPSDIRKLDVFKTRERDDSFVNEPSATERDAKPSKLLMPAKKGMQGIDWMDTESHSHSAAIIYNHMYDKLKAKGGMSEDEIRQRCEDEVNAYVRLLAQPFHRMDKSALYWAISQSATGRALLYLSSESLNKIGMMRANYIVKRNSGKSATRAGWETVWKGMTTVGLATFLIETIIAALMGNTPDDEDDSWFAWTIATMLQTGIGQHLEALPLIGAFTSQLFSPYARLNNDQLNIPGNDYKKYTKLYKMLTDNKKYSEAEWTKAISNFMKEFVSLFGLAGGAYSPYRALSGTTAVLQSISAGMNLPAFITRAVDANFSDDKKKKKKRRMKSLIEEALTPEPEKKRKSK